MSSGPHSYAVGDTHALFRMARGTCYFPGCPNPIMSLEDGHWIVAVDMAHIRGGKPNSARYDPAMTDAQRASYDNLILLCSPHHKLVDRHEREKYTTEVLTEWKHRNETAEERNALRDLVNIENLESLLERIAPIAAVRRVKVELAAGLITPQGVFTTPLNDLVKVLSHNPKLSEFHQVLVASVRNVGRVAVSLVAVDFYFGFGISADRNPAGEMTLMGNNELLVLNPELPTRILDGEAVNYCIPMERAHQISKTIGETHSVVSVRVKARLATGEEVASEPNPWPWPAVGHGNA